MTDKPAERTALSTWRTVGAVLANVAVAVLAPLLVFGPDRQPRAAGFLVLAALLATLAGLSYYLCWRGATERISAGPRDAADRHPIGIGTIAKGLLGNRNLVALSLASILLISINLYLGALQPYLFKDFFHAPELLSFIPLALAPSLLLLILTAQPLANRFGKKELACVGLGLALVADVQLYVLPMPFPALYLAWQALATLGIGYFSFLTWALVADVIDQHARDTGLRREATVYAVFSLSRKLGQALAGGLDALALSLAGYQSGQAGQSVETAEKLRSLVTFYPLIGTALMALILGFFYRLDRRTVHILHPGA